MLLKLVFSILFTDDPNIKCFNVFIPANGSDSIFVLYGSIVISLTFLHPIKQFRGIDEIEYGMIIFSSDENS